MNKSILSLLILSTLFITPLAWAQKRNQNPDHYEEHGRSDDDDDEETYYTDRVGGSGMSVIYSDRNFSEFTPFLGIEATESLRMSNWVANFTSGQYFNKFNIESASGFGHWFAQNDSVRYRTNNFTSSFLLGRSLVNNNWLLINPQLGIQSSWQFLRSSAIDRVVPISSFANQPQLQALFLQFQAIANLELAFKLPMSDSGKKQVWIVAKGGYFVPLNATPLIYSGRNRITTEQTIRSNNLQFEVGIMTITPVKKRRFELPDTFTPSERRRATTI